MAIIEHREDGDGSAPIGARHPRLVEVVTAEIRRRMLSGQWPPGHRLIESHVAAELGVSRNPVREALRSLVAEGFVEVEPRRGARVAVLSPDEAAHLFDVRSALEGLAAALAAGRRSPVVLAHLREIVEAGRAATDEGRLADVPPLNTAFHTALCDASGNPELTTIMRPLRDRIQWMYAARVRDRAPASWSEHETIVEAIARGGEATARRLAEEHIARAKEAFLDLGFRSP